MGYVFNVYNSLPHFHVTLLAFDRCYFYGNTIQYQFLLKWSHYSLLLYHIWVYNGSRSFSVYQGVYHHLNFCIVNGSFHKHVASISLRYNISTFCGLI